MTVGQDLEGLERLAGFNLDGERIDVEFALK
jgi:hypothetical protein